MLRHHMDLHIEKLWDGTPATPNERVSLQLSHEPNTLIITVDAPFHADPAPAAPVGALMRLWDFEVVELFILGPDEEYTEIELGPHGHHLVLQLSGVRNIVAECLPLEFEANISGARWRGTARLDRALLPSGPHRINAYAIHGTGESRRYLAWAPVPGEAPDYHRLQHFPAAKLF